MRVLVSGSTGLIGSALMAALDASPHTPVRLLRKGDGKAKDHAVAWDRSSFQLEAGALDGIDAVVHLAGEPIAAKRWTAAQKERILTSRTKSTAALAEAICKADNPPAAFLSGSAIGFYGSRGDEKLTEVSSSGEGFLAEVVRKWERAAEVAKGTTRLAYLRTGIVLSPYGGALGAQLPIFRLGLGGRIGKGDQWMSWIALSDVVGSIMWLLENDVSGPVNLCAPNPVTNTQFTSMLGKALGRPTFMPTPKFALQAKLGTELANELLYASQKVEPSALLASGYRFQHLELEPTLAHMLKK